MGRGLLHPFHRDLTPEAEVLRDGIGEDRIALENHAEMAPQLIQTVGAHITTIDVDMAFLRVVETHQKVHDGCLSASGGSYYAQASATLDPEVDVVECLLSFSACKGIQLLAVRRCLMGIVAERYIVEDYVLITRGLRGIGDDCKTIGLIHDALDSVGGGVGLAHVEEEPVEDQDSHQDHLEI